MFQVRTWNVATCSWFASTDRYQQTTKRGDKELTSFIASVSPEHVLPPGAECPWTVRVSPGQRINVTVHLGSLAPIWTSPDDEIMSSSSSTSSGSSPPDGGYPTCSVLAVEMNDGNRTAVLAPPCGQQWQQQQRFRSTYSSSSNELKVFVRMFPLEGDTHDEMSFANSAGFLLHFQGIARSLRDIKSHFKSFSCDVSWYLKLF